MLILACALMLKGEVLFFTGNLVKEKSTTYLISTADGYYEFPKELCVTKDYRAKK